MWLQQFADGGSHNLQMVALRVGARCMPCTLCQGLDLGMNVGLMATLTWKKTKNIELQCWLMLDGGVHCLRDPCTAKAVNKTF